MNTSHNISPFNIFDLLRAIALLLLCWFMFSSCCTTSTKNIARLERKVERKITKAEFNGCIQLDSAKLAQYDSVTLKHDTVFIPGQTLTLRDTIQLECDSLGNVHIVARSQQPAAKGSKLEANSQQLTANGQRLAAKSRRLTNNQIEILADCSTKDTTITLLSKQAQHLNKLLNQCNAELNQERKKKRTIKPLKAKGFNGLEVFGIGVIVALIFFIAGYIISKIY